jgi:Domain of unknown function (DUF4390)
MKVRRLVWSGVFALLIAASAAVTVHADESLRVTPLVRDDRVLVSFELTDGLTDEVRAAIDSGLRTTFTYTVELRMEVPLWVDRTIDSVVVTTSDHYDNLTRRHSLVRTLDGRVEEALVTEDQAVVKRFMTTLNKSGLFKTSKLEPNREYYIRVTVRATPHGGSIVGWGSAVSALARFTFIP